MKPDAALAIADAGGDAKVGHAIGLAPPRGAFGKCPAEIGAGGKARRQLPSGTAADQIARLRGQSAPVMRRGGGALVLGVLGVLGKQGRR